MKDSPGVLGSLDTATGWLNSPPLTAAGLRDCVVLVDFWTYTCINWIRSLPYVRAWGHRYRKDGLVVVGVHTPEFDVERDVGNVRRAAADLRVDYPIAIDNDYAIWRAFGNRYWPALYAVDTRGRVRHHRFGEGDYDRSERVIQRLLGEGRPRGHGDGITAVEADGIEAAADWAQLRSPETYLGYERGAAPRPAAEGTTRLNRWAVAGDWTQHRQAVVLDAPGGRIEHRFHARDLHLVMGPGVDGAPVRYRVRLDGEPPGAAGGADVDDDGGGTVTVPRLHHLVRQPGPVGERTFAITFLDPGVRAYAFTFG